MLEFFTDTAIVDALPIYNVTHTIRLLIIQRCETTLSWEQLRSPQISQFLVKPILQQIRASHFSRATLYALIANCLQFSKEVQSNPGNVGVLQTRALISELIAMRLLKEYTWRELIDVLSYDFDPLNGVTAPATGYSNRLQSYESVRRSRVARTSTLEVAIRAQAKRFLAHPSVVQHLEAIWQGNIIFNSAADNLHRLPSKPPLNQSRQYGATHSLGSPSQLNGAAALPPPRLAGEMIRRSVTLYNPQNASLFKLSRLRVPRYRQVFSTLSFAAMLILFLACLVERPRDITPLEVVFWFWSAGYMLDEVVGFTEQGFGLYIISVWNAFDIGILFMLLVYYVLRLYGLFLTIDENKHRTANMAYDVLASTAVLLFPRLFSLLDHYRYFSQLLIAFRLMAQDLAAILILIAISCSGFFVAFTLSFGRHDSDWSKVAYALFQILMGFTPAAWDVWFSYNILGKAILALFLIICHFLVVTILITVLTNSFMAIVKNAEEEHQYLFAVNTISLVKSDALFSYIPPTNIIGWVFSPLRWCMPFRQFVKVNRSIIKLTHLPVLALIYAWERVMLLPYAYEPESLVEQRGRRKSRVPFAMGGGTDVFSPGARLRKPSIATFHKDRALEEVFKRPFNLDSIARKDSPDINQRETVVDSWMKSMGKEGGPTSPTEQPRIVLDRLEARKPSNRRAMTFSHPSLSQRNISHVSDPDVRRSARLGPPVPQPTQSDLLISMEGLTTPVDGEADSDVRMSGDDGHESCDNSLDGRRNEELSSEKEMANIATSSTPKASTMQRLISPQRLNQGKARVSRSGQSNARSVKASKRGHMRNTSTNTIVFSPVPQEANSSTSTSPRVSPRLSGPSGRPTSARAGAPSYFRRGSQRPATSSAQRPSPVPLSRPRPVMPGRDAYNTSPNISRFLDSAAQSSKRNPSRDARALDLASDIGDNRYLGLAEGSGANLLSTSFQTQLDFASRMRNRRSEEESNMVSRMVLARMNTIEEGFKDILREVKGLRSAGNSRGTSAAEEGANAAKRLLRLRDKREGKMMQQRSIAEERLLSTTKIALGFGEIEAPSAATAQTSTAL